MKHALISGAGSGLAQTVIDNIKNDFVIFALDKNPKFAKRYEKEINIRCYICDITDQSQIEKIKTAISALTSDLDLIINFAGIVELGSLIEVAPQKFEKTLMVNFLGNYLIHYLFFPLIKNAQGRIIIVSSEYGKLLSLPFHSFYTMSKHALEAYADSLRREVQSLGVKVITIRPGSFKTEMVANIQGQFKMLVNETSLFRKPLLKMEKLMVGETKTAKDPSRITKVFRKAIYKKNPRLVYRAHNSRKMKFLNLLPSRIQDWILSKFF